MPKFIIILGSVMDLTVLSPKKYWNLNTQNLRIWPYLKIEEALHR